MILLGSRTVLVGLVTGIVFFVVPAHSASLEKLAKREHKQDRTIRHYTGTLKFFERHPKAARTHEGRRAVHRARVWVRVARRELQDTRRERREHLAARRAPQVVTYSADYWVNRQIAAAEVIGRESGGDPWPMCPDPFDGGGSWYDTVACENSGNWYDSPGHYRCGLQFDPMWETRFGRLCP